MQYHYVVMYDSSTEQWLVDSTTADLFFNNKLMFNDEDSYWLESGDEDYDIHLDIYSTVESKLATILEPHSLEQE